MQKLQANELSRGFEVLHAWHRGARVLAAGRGSFAVWVDESCASANEEARNPRNVEGFG